MDNQEEEPKEQNEKKSKKDKEYKKNKKEKKKKENNNNNNNKYTIDPELKKKVQDFLDKTLTPEEKEKLREIRKVIDPLLTTSRLKFWCDDRTLVRYLRARNWDITQATEMLKGSLNWRMKWKPESIRAEEVKNEMNNSGKMYICKLPDKQGRPIIYMKPGKDNTGPDKKEIKIKYLIYIMEKAARRFDQEIALQTGASKVLLLIDYKDTGFGQVMDPRNFGISREILDILQNQYPERLGNAFIVNPPWIFSQFWKIIYPLIDPITKEKIQLWSDKKNWKTLHSYIDNEALENYYGGTSEYVYNFEDYWQNEDKSFPSIDFEDDDKWSDIK